MKIYKTESGILIDQNDLFYLLEDEEWDSFINDDNLLRKAKDLISSQDPIENGDQLIETDLLPPIKSQEIWASGVTYYNSKLGRQEESKEAGGGDFYARVYVADRPELFFKSNAHRCVGSGDDVRIRKDSTWDVPEPELTLVITSNQKIVGYTIGNDMSSRSIEGENPLYLPQAKSYDGSASIGPCIYVTDEPLPSTTKIKLEILRHGKEVFADEIGIDGDEEVRAAKGHGLDNTSDPIGAAGAQAGPDPRGGVGVELHEKVHAGRCGRLRRTDRPQSVGTPAGQGGDMRNKYEIGADLTDAAFLLSLNDEFEAAGRLLRAAHAVTEVSTRSALFHYHRAREACSVGHRAMIPDVFGTGAVTWRNPG